MQVHLVDGTYELFRAFFGAPAALGPDGREVGATRGILRSVWSMLRRGDVTHTAWAFDTVIESFRNDLFPGYKTGEGLDPALLGQFELAERAVHTLGVTVWSMLEFEADDALATGADLYARDGRVERVLLCSPDKDLTQAVVGERIVCFDRRQQTAVDEAGVRARYGIGPASIPDWLALVGDTADGIPGLPRWGAKSASVVLGCYGHLEAIPDDAARWAVTVRGAAALAESLAAGREAATLYRTLATLRRDAPITQAVDGLRWRGVDAPALAALCEEIGFTGFVAEVASAAG